MSPTVAIVGCGAMGRVHASFLREHCRLVFVGRRRAPAEALASRFGGRVAGSFEEVLDRPEVRGVVIATPAEFHAEQAARALAAGKVTLVEKPMAVTPAEVRSLGEALASAPPGALMVAENYLYKPSVKLLRRSLPRIGPLRRVTLRKRTLQASGGWRAGHGALIEGGIHFVALLGVIVDERPESVTADFPGGEQPERACFLTASYRSGVRATIEYAWNRRSLPGGIFQHSRIEGAGGWILMESNGLYMACRAGGWAWLRLPGFADLMGFRAMARDFRSQLADPSRKPFSDYARARRDLEIIFAAYGLS